jgi:hypothetical protein
MWIPARRRMISGSQRRRQQKRLHLVAKSPQQNLIRQQLLRKSARKAIVKQVTYPLRRD